MTACVVTSLCEFLGVLNILDLYLNFSLVTERFELWRLVTTFTYMGDLGLSFVLKMYFAIRYSKLLEEGHYRGRTADFVMMWIFGAFSLLGLNAVCHVYKFSSWKPPVFLGPALVNAILYIWARRSPYIRMDFMGLFRFPAPCLPWVILGLELVLENGSIAFDVLGILVGHLFYFLTDTYPRTSGRHLLPTPGFLKAMFDQHDHPAPAAQAEQPQQPQQNHVPNANPPADQPQQQAPVM